MHRFEELWDELNSQLFCLRDAFDGPSPARDYFDESLAANEYELALHALCDFLLGHEPVILTANLINQISELHTMMDLRDDCGGALMRKLSE